MTRGALDELRVGTAPRAILFHQPHLVGARLAFVEVDGAERATALESHRDRRRVRDRALEVARAPVLDERDVGRCLDAGLHARSTRNPGAPSLAGRIES